MKKKLESELVSIAHRIIKLKGKEDIIKMHTEVMALYEKLTVLKFAHENFDEDIPTIGSDSSFFGMLDTAFNNKISDNIEIEDKIYINLDDNEKEAISEPLMETIKDMVAQMPQETEQVDAIFEESMSERISKKHDLDEITAGFEEMPVFEPVSKINDRENSAKKTLNDKLKGGGLNIGLNDKLAFIKHLFDGKPEDYDRVISQINTTATFHEAHQFINDIVKPDYQDWFGKEEFEERFLQIIEAKFQ
ncbi:hypothetical protein [Seonamhaeicola aphaedonensis]|uniref:Uncharacterized protein n=1 Tax=Seonamhaeicola aphaedonensis TaxID=1461338 RepID=A0A3D9HMH0_9FLAO|nr:hypothetical protein [Seonamhaeicola aphaedonensis]RED50692.1 hypothetical protein DFQ02_101729 [Seonamhaeicola aphaedonensis]